MRLSALRSPLPRGLAAWTRLLWSVAAFLAVGWLVFDFVRPLFAQVDTLGGADWDQMEAHRYLVVKTVRDFHQFPFWNPYGCGGHPSWAGPESGSTIVSPFALPYFLYSLPVAIRIEVAGSIFLGAIGAWLFARRFTSSAAAAAIVCILFVLNSRCVLQIGVGHAWHLYYAWMPWVFWLYDRASAPDARTPWRDAALAGAAMAMMVYTAAIYPMPETAVLLGIIATVQAFSRRSLRPFAILACAGAVAFGLSAPKLVPVLDTLRRFPRLVESFEVIQVGQLVAILTSKAGVYMGQWGWHEYGMYVGYWGFVALAIGAMWGRGPRMAPFLWAAGIALLLGLGNFHEYSPWNQLHKMPIFRSQHVPSRWEYPSLLLFAGLFAVAMERLLRAARFLRPLLEIALVYVAVQTAKDILTVSQPLMDHAFSVPWQAPKDVRGEYHQEKSAPASLRYSFSGYSEPALPAEYANVGVIDCQTFPGLNMFARDAQGHAPGLGAKGRAEPDYRGEAFTSTGAGKAVLTHFTPNEMVVETDGVTPGDLVVLNQNWDPGWRADGRAVLNYRDLNAVVSRSSNEHIVFRYRPRLWWPSLTTFALTVGILGFAARRSTRIALARRVPIPPSVRALFR